MIVDQQRLKDNFLFLLIFFMVIFFVTMITIDNMILFIFITICVFFGVGISAMLRIYSRRHQDNIDSDTPFRPDTIPRAQNSQQYQNNNIYVIDVGNEVFYKEPPPPRYGEELPPSYEEVCRNSRSTTARTAAASS